MYPENSAQMNSVADRVQQAVTSLNVEAVAVLYAPDVVIWHNFDNIEQNSAQNLSFLRDLFAKLKSLDYVGARRRLLPNGYVQQHVLKGCLNNGMEFAIPCCHVVEVSRGQLTRFDEYFDPAPLFAALKP